MTFSSLHTARGFGIELASARCEYDGDDRSSFCTLFCTLPRQANSFLILSRQTGRVWQVVYQRFTACECTERFNSLLTTGFPLSDRS